MLPIPTCSRNFSYCLVEVLADLWIAAVASDNTTRKVTRPATENLELPPPSTLNSTNPHMNHDYDRSSVISHDIDPHRPSLKRPRHLTDPFPANPHSADYQQITNSTVRSDPGSQSRPIFPQPEDSRHFLYVFENRENLLRERPHICQESGCKWAFARKDELIRHRKTVHEKIRWTCLLHECKESCEYAVWQLMPIMCRTPVLIDCPPIFAKIMAGARTMPLRRIYHHHGNGP